MAELFDSLPAGPVLCTFMHYSANDVISGMAIDSVGTEICKFGDSRSNRS